MKAKHGAVRVTKSPMSMALPATPSGVKVTKQQDTKEMAWVRTRGEGAWEWKEEHGTEGDMKRQSTLE